MCMWERTDWREIRKMRSGGGLLTPQILSPIQSEQTFWFHLLSLLNTTYQPYVRLNLYKLPRASAGVYQGCQGTAECTGVSVACKHTRKQSFRQIVTFPPPHHVLCEKKAFWGKSLPLNPALHHHHLSLNKALNTSSELQGLHVLMFHLPVSLRKPFENKSFHGWINFLFRNFLQLILHPILITLHLT